MTSPFASGTMDHRFGKISIEDALREDVSHLEGLSPTLVELYQQTLDQNLAAPWEGTIKHRTCHCLPPLPIQFTTEWEGENRGRQAFKCAASKVKGCNYNCLVDGPLMGSAPVMVNFLLDRVKKLVAANVVLQSKLTAIDVAAKSLVLDEEQGSVDCSRKKYLEDRHIWIYDGMVAEHCPRKHHSLN